MTGNQLYSSIGFDRLETHYRSVLAGMRICQLYFFMLMFVSLSKPVSYLMQWLAFGLARVISAITGQASSSNAPELNDLFVSFQGPELIVLLAILLVFRLYARFSPAYWAIVLCGLALAQNVWGQYQWTFVGLEGAPAANNGPDFSTELVQAGQIYMLVVVITHLYFLYVALRGQISIHKLNQSEREVLQELHASRASEKWSVIKSTVRELMAIPSAVMYSKAKVSTGLLTLISGVANFLNFWRLSIVVMILATMPLLISLSGPAVKTAVLNLLLGDNFFGSVIMLLVSLALPIIVALIFWVNVWFIRRLCLWSIRKARERMRVSLQDIQHLDQRAPILFLRSFLNDKVDLNGGRFSLEQWLLDSSSRTVNLDDLMLKEGTVYGPTVALGNPDDPAPPYGVARGYFSHDTWKDAVAKLCADSQFVVMVLDTTEGVDWEVKHIVSQRYVAKTLFLLSPDDAGKSSGAELLCRALAKIDPDWNGDKANQIEQGESIFGFVIDEDHSLSVLQTESLSSYSYLIALRFFTRQRLSLSLEPIVGEREVRL